MEFEIEDFADLLSGEGSDELLDALEQGGGKERLFLSGLRAQTRALPEKRAGTKTGRGKIQLHKILRVSRGWVLAATTFFAILVLGLGTTWAFFIDHPVLSDKFNDQWLNGKLWNTPRWGVKEQSGYVRLTNRAHLVTANTYAGAVDISFDWRWADLVEAPQYADHLTVVLRTSGEPRPTHSYEAMDGVAVIIDAQVGAIHISKLLEPEREILFETIASTELQESPLTSPLTSQVTNPLPAPLSIPDSEWHTVRVTDDGTTISVYLSGPNIDPKFTSTPVVQGHCSEHFVGQKIAIYNRELVGGVPHQSEIDNVAIYEVQR